MHHHKFTTDLTNVPWFVFLVLRIGCMALSWGAMGLSAVCDCVFPGHTHLQFFINVDMFSISKRLISVSL